MDLLNFRKSTKGLIIMLSAFSSCWLEMPDFYSLKSHPALFAIKIICFEKTLRVPKNYIVLALLSLAMLLVTEK